MDEVIRPCNSGLLGEVNVNRFEVLALAFTPRLSISDETHKAATTSNKRGEENL